MKKEQNKYQLDHMVKPLVFGLIKSHKNKAVKEYFKQHPEDLHLKGWMSDTPLHIACLSGNFEIVKYLIEKKVNVNAERTGIYATPLCWADTEEIANYLLDHGATMNDLELYMATRQDKIQIIDLLLRSGAMINEQDPQYLQCKSKEAIQLYLNHQIEINGSDSNESNLLHKLAWLDLPEELDFAMQKGVPWQKDSSRRTPFISAKNGGRKLVVNYLTQHYPELLSNRIQSLELNLAFEKIAFLLNHPKKISGYIALTENGRLISYENSNTNSLVIGKAIEIDVPRIRNFTIDDFGNLIIPTGENKLLRIDSTNFELLDSIPFDNEYKFDQITYLPQREIYIGSSSDWEITILDKNFAIISKTSAEDGTFFPIVNEKENLLAFWSYDHEVFFDLYEIEQEHTPTFIHTFFETVKSISKSFAFIGNEFLVAFPKKIEAFKLQGRELIKLQALNIEEYEAAFDSCSLTTIADHLFLFGKGKKVIVYEKTDTIHKIEEMQLELKEEIRQIYFDNRSMNLIVITNAEIIAINSKEKGWVQ